MMGTFATVLANQKIPTPQERFRADVTGDIEDVNGVLKITRINVHYTLKLTEDKQAAAQKAFEVYLPHCPAAQSVITAIQIDHQLEMEAL
ncbi:MAG: OsmC family protein [Desulfatitalea sp.]|nr:OsmC family protein [Desulfatitalea sp.]